MPKFNLMSYIIPPEDKMFFTYFQESAEICLKTAKLYDEIMHNHLNDEYKEKALKYKRKGKLSYKACLKQLNKSFITPIEREDIQTIAVQLNKITKKIVKATEKLGEIIKQFKKVSDVEEITELNIEMKEIESHGDEIHRRAMGNLFSGQYEALDVIKLRDMYKEIENAFDACFYVSDTILNVVLKQS